MALLLDTDIFYKLGLSGLIEATADVLGAKASECARLPALPHMLRRGRLRKRLGDARADMLIAVAEAMPSVGDPPAELIDRLVEVPAIDPGEAQLFAFAAADTNALVLSGDKRALEALGGLQEVASALSGRIVVLEAALIVLCNSLGAEQIRSRIAPMAEFDTAVKVCFSPGNDDPVAALRSYHQDVAKKVAPLELWAP